MNALIALYSRPRDHAIGLAALLAFPWLLAGWICLSEYRVALGRAIVLAGRFYLAFLGGVFALSLVLACTANLLGWSLRLSASLLSERAET